MDCEECSSQLGGFICAECEETLCLACDRAIHKGGKRRSHARRAVCQCGSIGLYICCGAVLCSSCLGEHSSHRYEQIMQPCQLALFWDLNTCKPMSSVGEILEKVEKQLGRPCKIQIYGNADTFEEFHRTGIQIERREGLAEIHAILLDISIVGAGGFSDALVLSANAISVKPHLLQLSKNMPNLRITVSTQLEPLTLVKLEDLPDVYEKQFCPDQQVFETKNALTSVLLELAQNGQLRHEYDWFLRHFKQRAGIPLDEAKEQLRATLSSGHVHKIVKQFDGFKEIELVSLRLTSLSLESLTWALKSLKNDEMLPTERSIQCRMKEAFDLKSTAFQWMTLLEACRAAEFSLIDFVDVVTGSETVLIYPKNEKWESVDHLVNDVLNVKDTEIWDALIHFLVNYFRKGRTKISGGKYACAQFLKMCGNPILKKCSLGKLSYMVQLAVQDDLFRYVNDSLVWVPVREAVLELLEDCPRMTLASLKSQMGMSIGDLLKSMPEVEIKDQGTPNEYVQLKKQSMEDMITTILDDHNSGLPGSTIDVMISAKLRQSIDWGEYGCSSIYEFVQKKTGDSFSLIANRNTKMIVKNEQRRVQSAVDLKTTKLKVYEHSKSTHSYLAPQRVVKVSTIPPDIVPQESGFYDFECEERTRTFIDMLMHGDISSKLHGNCPPKFRTDSIEYHSSVESLNKSFSVNKSKAQSEKKLLVPKGFMRQVRSYYEGFHGDLRPDTNE